MNGRSSSACPRHSRCSPRDGSPLRLHGRCEREHPIRGEQQMLPCLVGAEAVESGRASLRRVADRPFLTAGPRTGGSLLSNQAMLPSSWGAMG